MDNISVNSIGTLDSSNGGMPKNMWNYTDANYAFYLINNLPGSMNSPLVSRIVKRLLLTKADTPEGKTLNKDLFGMRLQKLIDTGDTQSIREIFNVVPESEFTEEYARLEVENLLLGNEYGPACAKTKSHIEKYPNSYWQKINLLCRAAEGKADEVELGVNLLSEQGEMQDMACCDIPLGEILLTISRKEAINYPENFYKHDSTGKIRVSNFEFAVLQAAKSIFPEKFIMLSTPAMQKSIALYSDTTPLNMRILAGELALGAGAIEHNDLAKIYDSYSWTGDLDSVMSAPSLPLRRAALFQMIQKSQDKNPQIIRKLIDSFSESGMGSIASYVLAPTFVELSEDLYHRPELIGMAEIAIPTLLASGHQNESGTWYGLLELNQDKSTEAARIAKLMRPLVKGTVSVSTSWNPEFINEWLEVYNGHDKIRTAGRLLTLVQAFRQIVPENAWNNIVINRSDSGNYKYPSPALLGNLKSASQKRQVAETILLSAHILGNIPARDTPEDIIAELIKALLAIDLRNEAQSLAVEALVE